MWICHCFIIVTTLYFWNCALWTAYFPSTVHHCLFLLGLVTTAVYVLIKSVSLKSVMWNGQVNNNRSVMLPVCLFTEVCLLFISKGWGEGWRHLLLLVPVGKLIFAFQFFLSMPWIVSCIIQYCFGGYILMLVQWFQSDTTRDTPLISLITTFPSSLLATFQGFKLPWLFELCLRQ